MLVPQVILVGVLTISTIAAEAAASTEISADRGQTWSIALGDLDGDGHLDLIAGNFEQPNRLYLNNGTHNSYRGVSGMDVATDAGVELDSGHHRHVAIGDFDRDGALDLCVANDITPGQLFINNGSPAPFNGVIGMDVTAANAGTKDVALGGVDGDGTLDLIAGNSIGEGSCCQPNRVYLNNGTADPFAGVAGQEISSPVHWGTNAVALGDVDGDGKLDLVTGNSEQPNRLYLNNGTPAPFEGVVGSAVTLESTNTVAVELGDVDSDGDLDVVFAYGSSHAPRIYPNNGTSKPFLGVTPFKFADIGDYTVDITLGDVDGDGDLDLVAGNLNQPSRLDLNNGTMAPFDRVKGTAVSRAGQLTWDVALADVDSDGALDLILGNDSQPNRLYLNRALNRSVTALMPTILMLLD